MNIKFRIIFLLMSTDGYFEHFAQLCCSILKINLLSAFKNLSNWPE